MKQPRGSNLQKIREDAIALGNFLFSFHLYLRSWRGLWGERWGERGCVQGHNPVWREGSLLILENLRFDNEEGVLTLQTSECHPVIKSEWMVCCSIGRKTLCLISVHCLCSLLVVNKSSYTKLTISTELSKTLRSNNFIQVQLFIFVFSKRALHSAFAPFMTFFLFSFMKTTST